MRKTTLFIVAAITIALAFVLNPSPDRHRDKIKQVISERSQIERIFGVGLLTSFAAKYHSLGVASYTTLDDKTISVGAFGMVFVAD